MCRIGVEMDLQQVHDGTVRDIIFMEERMSVGSSSSILISGGAGSCRLCITNLVAELYKYFALMETKSELLGLAMRHIISSRALTTNEHRDKVIQCRWHPRDFVFLSTKTGSNAFTKLLLISAAF
uniref:FGGY_C domain-containing protein n=1 Tax=Globodera pallida TaxID=36090 RepID=A0A183CGY4_GLOPA